MAYISNIYPDNGLVEPSNQLVIFDPNSRDENGNTPILSLVHGFCSIDWDECDEDDEITTFRTRLLNLVSEGADINAINHKGETALLNLSTNGHLDECEFIIGKCKVDVSIPPEFFVHHPEIELTYSDDPDDQYDYRKIYIRYPYNTPITITNVAGIFMDKSCWRDGAYRSFHNMTGNLRSFIERKERWARRRSLLMVIYNYGFQFLRHKNIFRRMLLSLPSCSDNLALVPVDITKRENTAYLLRKILSSSELTKLISSWL